MVTVTILSWLLVPRSGFVPVTTSSSLGARTRRGSTAAAIERISASLSYRERRLTTTTSLKALSLRSFCTRSRATAFQLPHVTATTYRSTLVPSSTTTISRRSMTLDSAPADTTSSTESHQPLRLVDVDCNLWHPDLRDILQNHPTALLRRQQDSAAASPKNEDAWNANPWDLLQPPNDDWRDLVALLVPASNVEESLQGVALLQRYTPPSEDKESSTSRIQLRTTIGVHPYHVVEDFDKYRSQVSLPPAEAEEPTTEKLALDSHHPVVAYCMQQLRSLYETATTATAPSVIVAVGECGLDASPGFPPLDHQLPWWKAHVELAYELQLPLFVHERLAHQPLLDVLDQVAVTTKQPPPPVLIHCFTGTPDELATYLDRGYYVSLSGYVCKPAAADLCRVLREGALWPQLQSKLMVETDAPYMGFQGGRQRFLACHTDGLQALSSKKRKKWISSNNPNVPSALVALVQENILPMINEGLANQKLPPISVEELARLTTDNAQRFFQWEIVESEK